MIVIKLIGGLGNQCFQYAVGRHLAEIQHAELKIDISEFKTYKWHAHSLYHYNIIENYATSKDLAGLKHVKEKHLHFDREILSLPDGIYLNGYWGSEKYFTNISEIIRHELTVKAPLSGKNKEIAEMIMSCNSVSVHVRRYLPNMGITEFCGLDYYLRSVKQITRTIIKPHFFIFSDDKEWTYANFKLPCPVTFVDYNGPSKDYEDMRLISLCKHNINANSTFSWWGAWLNKNTDKMVFAPKKWFTEKARNSAKDVIPDSWIKV